MKLGQPAKNVLLLHLVFLAAGTVIGAVLGGQRHIVLGISLGSLLGSLIPGIAAEIALKRKGLAGEMVRLCAGVYNNRWVTGDDMRDTVQDIRGQVYGPWMGLVIGSLLSCYLLQLSAGGCLLAATALAAVAWLFGKMLG